MANRGINKVILIGNLGKDPEIRYMPSGGSVANITIATSETWKDKNTGENREKVEWHRVVIFGKLAEISGQFLKKGAQVYIEGFLQTRQWKDKNGIDRYTTEVVVNITGKMQMLGSRINNDQNNLIKHSSESSKNDKLISNKKLLDKNTASHNLQTEISNIDFDEDLPF